jgi:subtilisin family serine protease
LCPANENNVIAVSATDSKDNLASFSSTGQQIWVAAPGVSVLSFSSPHVAGLVALLLSANPLLMPPQIRTNLQESSDHLGTPGFNNDFGYGRINAYKALHLAERGTLSDFEGQAKVVAFPNPAKFSSGSVTFVLPPSLQGSNLTIKLYTIAGELVRQLTGLTWDGRNDAGAEVATGTYIFLVKTDAGSARGRVAVIH